MNTAISDKRILRLKEVLHLCGLSRSTVYNYIERDLFPKPIKLGARGIGWVAIEISEWIEKRMCKREDQLQLPVQD